jgi:hypothetical protein
MRTPWRRKKNLPTQSEIDYTLEGANRLAGELRAIPAKDPAKRKLTSPSG